MSFHASQEIRRFVARSQGEEQLVGGGQDHEDENKLQLAWPASTCWRPEESAGQHIQCNAPFYFPFI
jgi:predicted cupin superfamily sugar epimerase